MRIGLGPPFVVSALVAVCLASVILLVARSDPKGPAVAAIRANGDPVATIAKAPEKLEGAIALPIDEVQLEELAAKDVRGSVRRAALRRLTDQDLLARLAVEGRDPDQCEAAVKQLYEQRPLEKVAATAKYRDVRYAAIRKMTNESALAELAIETDDVATCEVAVSRLTDLARAEEGRGTRNGESSLISNRFELPSSPLDSDFPASAALTHVARRAIGRKDYDFAIRLLRAAISFNENDAGASYDPFVISAPDATSRQHGQKQLAAMLADRPQMKAFLKLTDDLYEWAVRAFARRINGAEIYWSSEAIPGPNPFLACHLPPTEGRPGRIQINPIGSETIGSAEAFTRLWNCAVFELHNIESAREFIRLDGRAYRSAITEEDFVKGAFVLEWKNAAQRTRRFYVDVFLPHATKYGIPTDPNVWYFGGGCWGTADSVFDRYTDKTEYPWRPYSLYYRELHYWPIQNVDK
jgi:hypothetical protein